MKFLVSDARTPYLEIARKCGISGAAVHQRIKKLENNGIINGSKLNVSPKAVGLNICAFIAVQARNINYKQLVETLRERPEITECHFITGEYTMLLKIYCRNDENLMKLILSTVQSIPDIAKIETWLSLDQPIDRNLQIFDPEQSQPDDGPQLLQ